MTKGEGINLYNALNKLGQLSGVRFAYAVTRNIALLKPEYEALQEAVKPTEDYQKFEKERIALVESFAQKDENGKPVTENNEYVLEDKAAFEVAFDGLKEGHKKAIDARKIQIEEQNELLKTDLTVELYKVSLSNVPEEISVAQMHSISAIVTEDVVSPFTK